MINATLKMLFDHTKSILVMIKLFLFWLVYKWASSMGKQIIIKMSIYLNSIV
jgi:hypothetical protein